MNSLKTFTVGAGGAAVIGVTDIQAHSVAVSAVSYRMLLRMGDSESSLRCQVTDFKAMLRGD